MPTVCKIMLDASDYRKELQAVLAESRAASATLGNSYQSASESVQDLADSLDNLPDARIEIKTNAADAANEIRTEMASIKDQDVSINTIATLPEIPVIPDQTYTVTGKADDPEIPQISDQAYKITGTVIAPEIPQIDDQIYTVTGKVVAPDIPKVEDQEYTITGSVNAPDIPAVSDQEYTITGSVNAPDVPKAEDQTYVITGSVNVPDVPKAEDQTYVVTGSVNAPDIPAVSDQEYTVTGSVNAPDVPKAEDQTYVVTGSVNAPDVPQTADQEYTITGSVNAPDIPVVSNQEYTVTGSVNTPDVPKAEDQTYVITGSVNAPDIPAVSDQEYTVTGSTNAGEIAEEARTAFESIGDKQVTISVTNNVTEAAEAAKTALYSIPDHKEVNITIPEVQPVSVSVIADTVKIAELKAQIAELEDKEITAQVKVVDDQIALLQQELDAIQSKDITVTTEADLQQAEKLKGVIAALQDKKITIQTEVHSEKLDNLRTQLQQTQSGAGKFGMTFKNLIPQNFGANIGKGATLISAFGAAAGASVPPVGMLAAAVNALLSPVALVMAALSALVAIGMAVWDKLTVSAEEYAEKTRAASEEAQRQAEKVKAQDQAAQGYIARLQEIASAETAGNAAKTETLQLLNNLESQYGDLGAVIDETTGKITNLAEVEERANAARNQKLATARYNTSEAQMNEAKAAYMKVKGNEWFTTEAGAGKSFDAMRKMYSPEQMLKIMESRAAKATTQEDITGYNEVVSKLRTAIESRNKARQINSTGYETKEEYQAAMAKKSQQVGQAKTTNILLDKSAERKKADNELTFIRDSDAKIANRQGLIDKEKERQSGIQKEVDRAQSAVDAADTPEKKLDAQKRLLDAQAQYKRSQASIVDLEQQIAQIKYEQSEAKRKLNEQTTFELEYNKLIAAGEYDKAAALKLERDLKQQNLKLSEEEKQKLLEQQKLIGSQKLNKSMKDQAFNLYGQAMEKTGRGKEFAEERALKEARETKGRDLTSDETAKVKKLSAISYDFQNQRTPQLGDTSIKTNSLSSRGGFSGGVKMPDTEKIAREACNYNKRQAETAEKIKQLLEDLGKD